MSNFTLEERLDKLIEFWDNYQNDHYEPDKFILLSYLLDLKNDDIPSWVLESQKTGDVS